MFLKIAARTDGERVDRQSAALFQVAPRPANRANPRHTVPSPKNPPPSFALRPVAPPDDGFLLRLYASTRAAELARSGWDAARREEFIRGQFQARRTDHALRFPGAEHAIIVIEGREAGVWTVARSPHEIRLVNIELLPERQGLGIGTALLQRLIVEALATGVPLALSVRDDNRAAARLYRRLGFASHTHETGYVSMRYAR